MPGSYYVDVPHFAESDRYVHHPYREHGGPYDYYLYHDLLEFHCVHDLVLLVFDSDDCCYCDRDHGRQRDHHAHDQNG